MSHRNSAIGTHFTCRATKQQPKTTHFINIQSRIVAMRVPKNLCCCRDNKGTNSVNKRLCWEAWGAENSNLDEKVAELRQARGGMAGCRCSSPWPGGFPRGGSSNIHPIHSARNAAPATCWSKNAPSLAIFAAAAIFLLLPKLDNNANTDCPPFLRAHQPTTAMHVCSPEMHHRNIPQVHQHMRTIGLPAEHALSGSANQSKSFHHAGRRPQRHEQNR